jgi:mono/diheme cytochrome c family protein
MCSLPGPIANRLRHAACISAFALFATACTEQPKADPSNSEQVARGKRVYEAQCAACHGAKLEGQPNWRERLPSGRFPAPPHDPGGHTWHHSDTLLFSITKNGIERHAPPGYKSDMPAFGNQLSDNDIWAVLAYIKSTWPEETRQWQAEVSREDARARR